MPHILFSETLSLMSDSTFTPYPVKPAVIGDVTVGNGPVRTLASLTSSTESGLLEEQHTLGELPVDILEWRLDHFEQITKQSLISAAMSLRAHANKPILGTLRTINEGGACEISDENYRDLAVFFAGTKFLDAMDYEIRRGEAQAAAKAAHDAGMPVIMSFHNFEKTPPAKEIRELFAEMAAAGADILKIAVIPKKPEDVLLLMQETLAARKKHGLPIISIAMGPMGAVTRAAGRLFGADATFVAGTEASAPGQLSAEESAKLLPLFDPFTAT